MKRFHSMKSTDLVKQLVVIFEGEDGEDGGALTTSLYTRLFKSVASDGLLQSLDGESNLLTVAMDDAQKNETDTNWQYDGLGKALIKMIYDQRTMPLCLAPYFMRFLICSDEKEKEFEQTLTLDDVEMIDPVFGRNMRMLLLMDNVQDLSLDFTELDENDEREVNNETRRSTSRGPFAKG